MKRAFFANEKEGSILFFSILIFLGSMILFFAISIVLAIPLFQLSFMEILERVQNAANPENRSLVIYLQIVQGIGTFIVSSIFIGYLVTRKPLTYLKLNQNTQGMLTLLAILTIILANPLINMLAYLNQELKLPDALRGVESWMYEKEKAAEEITMLFLNVKTFKGLLINIFMIGIIPALGEEMFFRGVMQNQLVKITKNAHAGVLITAFFFSAIHLQFYGFLPRFILGAYLGYLFVWTGNLWYPVIVHFANNTLAVLMYFFLYRSGIEYDVDGIGITKDTILPGIVSTLLTVFLIYQFYKMNTNQHQRAFRS